MGTKRVIVKLSCFSIFNSNDIYLGVTMEIDKTQTNRGFEILKFTDRYGEKCSLQESSLASEAAIWLGVDVATPQIMASQTPEGGTGWVPYFIPENVLINTRMHLTQEQVKDLLPHLTRFAETGEL